MQRPLRYFLLLLSTCILLPCFAHGRDAALFIPRRDAFWQAFTSYTQTASKSVGLDLQVYNAQESAKAMLNQVETVCSKGIDAVIFMNYQGIGESILKIAEKYRPPAFLVNTSFIVGDFAPRGKYRHWIGELTADDRYAGSLLASGLAEAAGENGINELNIFAFQGKKKDIASSLRMEGLTAFIETTDQAKLVAAESAHWDKEQAKALFRKVLKEHPRINMVWGANDRMALGAAEAAADLGIEKPIVYGGIDWGLDALKALDKGIIHVDVGGHVFDGALAAIMVFDYLNGFDFAGERLRFTSSMTAITKSNIHRFNTILDQPERIDFKSLSKTHNPKLLQYNFDLNSILKSVARGESKAMEGKWLDRRSRKKTVRLNLTWDEEIFLEPHPVIRISNEMDWPPFDFAVGRRPMGFCIDLLKLVAERIGVEFEFINGYSWPQLMEMFKKREIDVIHPVHKTKEREKHGLFTPSFYSSNRHFIIRRESPEINDIRDLHGKTMAIPKGWAVATFLREQHPEVNILYFDTMPQALEAVDKGAADATFGIYAVARYHLRKHLLTGLKISGRSLEYERYSPKTLHFLIRKDWPILHRLFEKALLTITLEEIRQLREKWIGKEDDMIKLYLTPSEYAYLHHRDVVRMSVVPDWMPFGKINDKGEYEGMGADFIRLVSDRIDKEIVLQPTRS